MAEVAAAAAAGPTTAASHALEQFVLLAKSARGAAAAQLVSQALAAPGVYAFAELLDMPNIIELKQQPEHAGTHQLLELFASGVYADYVRQRQQLPELTAQQLLKLRHLTIVTMATRGKCIPYPDLLKELGVESTRELEDIIISAIYSDVIRGKIDQRGGRLEVEYAAGRDVRPEHVPHVLATLEAWCRTCDTVMQAVEHQIATANSEKEARSRHRAAVDAKIAAIRKNLKSQDQDEPMSSDSKETVTTSEKAKKLKTKSAKPSSSKLWRS